MKNLLIEKDLVPVVPLANYMKYFGKKVLFMEIFLENSERRYNLCFMLMI